MTLVTPRQPREEDASPARTVWIGPRHCPGSPEEHNGIDDWGDTLPPSGVDLAVLNASFESARSEDVLAWAFGEYGPAVSVVSSFQNCVLIDLATQIDSRAEIIFLDTGSHFAETLSFVEQVNEFYGLNLRIITPGANAKPWPCGSERCCELRKVAPLAGALRGHDAWVSGLKRSDTQNRASSPIVGWDSAQGLVKINPLARWTNDDVSRYEAEHRLPVHPLKALGYPSIGCEPTTRPVSRFEDPRAGRWPGTDKTECGLHV